MTPKWALTIIVVGIVSIYALIAFGIYVLSLLHPGAGVTAAVLTVGVTLLALADVLHPRRKS